MLGSGQRGVELGLGAAVCALGAAVLLSGCGAYFDLDVTVFTEVNFDEELVGLDVDRPASPMPYLLTETTPVDLTEQMDSKAGDIGTVILDEMAYRVPENAMTADLVDVRLFIGPEGVAGLNDSQVLEIGSIPRVPAGATIATQRLNIDAVKLDQIEALMDELRFTLLVSGYVSLQPEPAALPAGKCRIEVDVRGEAHLK